MKFDLVALGVDRFWSVCGLALSKCRLVVFELDEIEFLVEVLSVKLLPACKFLEIGIWGI